MTDDPVLSSVDERGVATVTLNRPHVNNVYDGELIARMYGVLGELGADTGLRAVLLRGNGRHFQAGADLTWMASVRARGADTLLESSVATGRLFERLNRMPVPVVALVHGVCFGGGTGFVAASDVVLAAEDARFSIAEVRWGLTPSIILPQLGDAIGLRQVRRFALTGERFDAQEARRIGLVHDVVPVDRLDERAEEVVKEILQNGRNAVAETKAHALEHGRADLDDSAFDRLTRLHAAARQSADASEGLAAFAERRPPRWVPGAATDSDSAAVIE